MRVENAQSDLGSPTGAGLRGVGSGREARCGRRAAAIGLIALGLTIGWLPSGARAQTVPAPPLPAPGDRPQRFPRARDSTTRPNALSAFASNNSNSSKRRAFLRARSIPRKERLRARSSRA